MNRPTANATEEHNLSGDGGRLPLPGKPPRLKALMMVWPVVVLGALVAFGAVPRLLQSQSLINHTHAQLAQAPAACVAIAQSGPSIDEFTLPASTQAIQDAPIYARVSGYLSKRYVDIGDHVHAGQILADIDTPELDKQVQAATSAVEQANANLDNAREAFQKATADQRTAAANTQKAKTDLQYYTIQVARYKLLVSQGAISREDLDTRTQAYNAGVANLDGMVAAERSAEASVRSAKAAVHVAQAAMDAAQAQRDQYQATRSFKKVTALFDGIVTQRNVDAGALITSGSNTTNTVLFEIAKIDELRVFVNVPEQYIPDIHVGEKALLSVQEYPGKDFVGTVAHVSGGLDTTSKTLQVEIHVPNPDRKLLPGMYVQVRFQSPARTHLAVVPATAVQTRPDGCFIYTVGNDNRVAMHKVEIGRDLGGQFEIARGVSEGDRVIISPSDEIQEGLLVAPVMAAVAAKNDGK